MAMSRNGGTGVMGISVQERESIIHNDIGNRGISSLFPQTQGSLQEAVKILVPIKKVAILTGFNLPPQETDGPPGALSIGRALVSMGKEVSFIVDNFSYDIMREGIVVSNSFYNSSPPLSLERLILFEEPLLELFKKLTEPDYNFDAIISIEHVGPSYADGRLYRMSGKDVTELQGSSHLLWDLLEGQIPRIAIGDGGNELGCGKILSALLDPACQIPNIKKIACKSTCNQLILSGVSNWGGYALALSLAPSTSTILSVDGEREILKALVKVGAVDPHYGPSMYVDRLPFDPEHARIIEKLLGLQISE